MQRFNALSRHCCWNIWRLETVGRLNHVRQNPDGSPYCCAAAVVHQVEYVCVRPTVLGLAIEVLDALRLVLEVNSLLAFRSLQANFPTQHTT